MMTQKQMVAKVKREIARLRKQLHDTSDTDRYRILDQIWALDWVLQEVLN